MTMSLNSRWLTALAVVASAAVLARADDKKIKITVVAVLASTTDKKVDQELNELAQQMRKKDPTLTGFVVERSATSSISIGEKATFEMIDKQFVDVLLREKNPVTNRVSLTMTPPTLGEIAYTVCCGKYFPVCTGY